MDDDGLVRGDLDRQNVPDIGRGKRNQALAASRGEEVLEAALAGDCAAEKPTEAAFGFRLHLHVGTHPAHRSRFADNGFSVFEGADHHRHIVSLIFVLHVVFSFLFCSDDIIIENRAFAMRE